MVNVKKNVVNLTPHPVTIGDRTIESSGIVRVEEEKKFTGYIDGIPVYETKYLDCQNLPSEQDDTIYIVSIIVVQACPSRTDLYTPGDLLRDAKGRIIGCKGIQRIVR